MLESKEIWEKIEREFGINKRSLGKKINFVSGNFRRSVIFRDVEHAYQLSCSDFPKRAVILAGGVSEELLRLYLDYKKIVPIVDNFNGYIMTCDQNGLLKSSISKLSTQ